jgi:hypothetical protein
MSHYRTSPLLPLIGMLIGAVFMLLLFSGCATTQQINQKTLADLRDTACPLTQAVILGLQLDPAIDPKIKEQLVAAEPFVTAACAADSTIEALHAMSDKAFPVVIETVMKSPTLTPEQKQSALVTLTAARIVIVQYRSGANNAPPN